MHQIPDEIINRALDRVDTESLRAGFNSLASQIPPNDWSGNFVASIAGPRGKLKALVEEREPMYRTFHHFEWNTHHIEVVGEVTGLGKDAAVLQWASISNPQHLAELCAAILTTRTGESIAWPVPPEPPELRGTPEELRQIAIQFLSAQIDSDSRSKFLEVIEREGLQQFAGANHLFIGMAVRNKLRSAGFTDETFDGGSLEKVWAPLFHAALLHGSERADAVAGVRDERNAKEDADKHSPDDILGPLPSVLVLRGMTLGENVTGLVLGPDAQADHIRSFAVRSECMFFVLHLFRRMSSGRVEEEFRQWLDERLNALLTTSFVEAMLGHWPEERKAGIHDDLLADLEATDREYRRYIFSSRTKVDLIRRGGADLFRHAALRLEQALGVANDESLRRQLLERLADMWEDLNLVEAIERSVILRRWPAP